MNILAIIPARSGSKTIPHKNLYRLCGKSLLEYTIDVARDSMLSGFIYDTVLSTDSEQYAKIFKDIQTRIRPKELAQDNSPVLPTILDVLQFYKEVRAVVLLQPTSPLRTAADLNKAISLFEKSKAKSLYSGYYMGLKTKNKTYDKHTTPLHFQRNGAIFITHIDLLKQGKLWDENVIEFEMPKSRSIDIDDMEDMYMAESILKNRKGW